ncbi:MAG: uroporphyrinogen decarboxylase family protein, partial [Clostridiales Family XIII bacterium]|nr:uroporphyrinogen decarboxylase family protein [Clostridiales Family XIII bacterium]
MMGNQLYEENLARFLRAVALEPQDRVPYIPVANAYYAKSEGVPLKDYISDPALACDTNLKAAAAVGGYDGTQSDLFTPWLLPGQWLSSVYLPGAELGGDEMWQVVEAESMSREDYRTILEGGFGDFYDAFLAERCGDPATHLAPFFEYLPTATQRFADAGMPCVSSFNLVIPFEMFCGGRSLEQ